VNRTSSAAATASDGVGVGVGVGVPCHPPQVTWQLQS
jgi:hypothetical protein